VQAKQGRKKRKIYTEQVIKGNKSKIKGTRDK